MSSATTITGPCLSPTKLFPGGQRGTWCPKIGVRSPALVPDGGRSGFEAVRGLQDRERGNRRSEM